MVVVPAVVYWTRNGHLPFRKPFHARANRSHFKVAPRPRGTPTAGRPENPPRWPHAFLLRIAEQYGDIVRYPVGPLTVYLLAHPDHVKHVLQDNTKNYTKDTFQYNLLSSITGNGLLTSDGDSGCGSAGWRSRPSIASASSASQG